MASALISWNAARAYAFAVEAISPRLASRITGIPSGTDWMISFRTLIPGAPNASKNAELGLIAATRSAVLSIIRKQ